VALDALSHGGAFTPGDLLARAAAEPGARGCRRLAEVVALAEPKAESPPQTRLRVALVRAGLPRPVAQYRVVDEGDQVGAGRSGLPRVEAGAGVRRRAISIRAVPAATSSATPSSPATAG
jgi:hypothetical protein